MTQYNVRTEETERSMWLKYKGNIAIEWTVGNVTGGNIFDWIELSDASNEESSANSAYPFRSYDDNYLVLYLSDTQVTKAFKKAELDLEFNDTFATEGDDGEGVKLNSKKAYDVNNSMNIKGYIESDTWRNEQPFTSYGPEMKAYSLPQKELMLHNMAKRSGVQGFEGEHPSSSFQNPVTVHINYGLNYYNFNNFLKYLMDEESKTYLQARQELARKWMPGYVENWNWSSNLTDDTINKGTPYAGTPQEKVEFIYSNCVLDDIQIKESASSSKIPVEIRLLFDTNNKRWTANRYLFKSGEFSNSFKALYPWEVGDEDSIFLPTSETAPSTYEGPEKDHWP